jgi:protein-disulfide isomerase
MKKIVLVACGALVAGVAFAAGILAPKLMTDASAGPDVVALDGEGGGQPVVGPFDTEIRSFLERHPEVVIEAQQRHAQMKAEEDARAIKVALAESRDQLASDPGLAVIGNPAGSKTIIEFFDYNCGYCRRAHEDMLALKDAHPDLKIVLRPFPILGPESMQAHMVASAFQNLMPEKYADFHEAMLTSPGSADENSAIAVAKSFGADEAALRAEMAKSSINDAFSRTYALAGRLQITGTPSYVIGDEIIGGAVGFDTLSAALVDAATN